MKILSWDIGIKNLAYCWVDYNSEEDVFRVLNWEIINLSEPEVKEPVHYCSCYKKDGVKCAKKATWFHLNNYQTYCQTHRKTYPEDMMLEIKKNTCSHILVNKKVRCSKKIKYVSDNNLVGYCETHHHKYENLEKVEKKKKTKNEIETISTNLIQELDKRAEMWESDYILIENQPAFKNPKMKSVQMVLYTYYLMRSKLDGGRASQKICFLMANNKLKVKLESEELKEGIIQKIHQKTKDKYRRHKLLSQEYCSWFLEKSNILDISPNIFAGQNQVDKQTNWLSHYQNHKKKDDLADTYLMCVYGQQNCKNF